MNRKDFQDKKLAPSIDNTSRDLGKILRNARRKKCMSQYSLAEAANINNSYYCSIEQGTVNITMKKFLSICDGLQVRPDDMMWELRNFRERKDGRDTQYGEDENENGTGKD